MHLYRARWMLPVASPPLRDGWIGVADGRIAAVGRDRPASPGAASLSTEEDLGSVAVLPGLVNAHTHLELSYLRGRVDAAPCFTHWVRQVMLRRREQPDASAPVILEALDAAIAEAHAAGTAAVGDVSNTLVSVPALRRAGMPGRIFYELLRLRASEAEAVFEQARRAARACAQDPELRVWPAAHAPYSVSRRLLELVARALAEDSLARTSVHLAEGGEELELLRTGTGPWRGLLEAFGAWDPEWQAPGCGPVEYLDRAGLLGPRTLVVHGVQLSDAELACLADRGATLVTCPRSNRHVGAGEAPVARFYASGVRLATGTDSLASAPDLNVFAELAELRRLAPDVPARRLLESATRVGAEALGLEAELGTIEPGRRAALLAVAVPARIGTAEDLEEYLVSGIVPSQVRWVA